MGKFQFSDKIETFRENLSITHPGTRKENIILGDITDLYRFLDVPENESVQLSLMFVQTKNEVNQKNKAVDISGNQDIKNIVQSVNDIDVIVGGPPCQGFSVMGRAKKGTQSLRSFGFVLS